MTVQSETPVHTSTDTVIVGEIETSWGTFGAVITERGVAQITFPDYAPEENTAAWVRRWAPQAHEMQNGPALAVLANQLTAYLHGDLQEFSLPLDLRGTPFQQQVWWALCEIPYGEVRSYGWVANRIGRPTAARAVGMANGANPIPVIVPCHRVIGSNGTLTGYGGGMDLKERLLGLEQVPGWSSQKRLFDQPDSLANQPILQC